MVRKKVFELGIVIIAITNALMLGLFYFYLFPPNRISQSTKDQCLFGAYRAKAGLRGTEFENWNFYRSCLYNVACANPIQVCPTELIEKEAAGWK